MRRRLVGSELASWLLLVCYACVVTEDLFFQRTMLRLALMVPVPLLASLVIIPRFG